METKITIKDILSMKGRQSRKVTSEVSSCDMCRCDFATRERKKWKIKKLV